MAIIIFIDFGNVHKIYMADTDYYNSNLYFKNEIKILTKIPKTKHNKSKKFKKTK